MNKEELSRQYADQKVEERGEYTNCDFHRRKSLTKFDGYDIEQAFEDGLTERDKHLWKDAQGDDLPEIDREVIALIDYAGNGYYKVVFAHRPDPERKVSTSLLTGKKSYIQAKTYDKGGWNQSHVKFWMDINLPEFKEQRKNNSLENSERELIIGGTKVGKSWRNNPEIISQKDDFGCELLQEEVEKYLDNNNIKVVSGISIFDFARHIINWQRKQIMNSAIDGYIDQVEYPGSTLIQLSENPKDLENGDDVKVIIIKNKEK